MTLAGGGLLHEAVDGGGVDGMEGVVGAEGEAFVFVELAGEGGDVGVGDAEVAEG